MTPPALGPLAPVLDGLRPDVQAEVREAVVSLAAGVAHEINNPLGYALSNLTFVLDRVRSRVQQGDEDPELLAALVDALDGVERVRRVVVHLVVSARSDSYVARAVDVRAALDAALESAAAVTGVPVRLIRDYRAVPAVLVDEGTLLRVFRELLLAVERTESLGPPPPLLEVRVASDDRRQVVVDIRPILPGADLAAPAELARELGGQLEIEIIESRRVARLVLPPGRVEIPQRGATPVPGEVEAKLRARVLVIDDEGLMTKVVERILSRDGLDVVCFSDARAALAHLEAPPAPDLILCDLMMPELSGMDFHAELSVRDPGLARRVVFVTGGASTPRARDFLREVPNGRLAKPFSAAALRAVVREQLARL